MYNRISRDEKITSLKGVVLYEKEVRSDVILWNHRCCHGEFGSRRAGSRSTLLLGYHRQRCIQQYAAAGRQRHDGLGREVLWRTGSLQGVGKGKFQ